MSDFSISFLKSITQYQLPFALNSAIELDLFTFISKNQKITSKLLSEKMRASEKGIDFLCKYLVLNKFLSINENEEFYLTEESEKYLNKESPDYMGDISEFLVQESIPKWMNLTKSIKDGGFIQEKSSKMWVKYAKVMTPSNSQIEIVAKIGDPYARDKIRVLDIACSHGMFGQIFLTRNPNAICYGLDFEDVIQIAIENSIKFSVNERYHTIPGNVLEVDFKKENEEDYDLILIPNLLHYLSKEQVEIVLKKSKKSLKDTGKIIVLEILARESSISWVPTVMNLVMIATSASGEVHTIDYYKQLFDKCELKITNEINGDPLILFELKNKSLL